MKNKLWYRGFFSFHSPQATTVNASAQEHRTTLGYIHYSILGAIASYWLKHAVVLFIKSLF